MHIYGEAQMNDRILRIPEVMQRVGFGRSQIYKLERAGQFPKHMKISTRASGWSEREVASWLESKKTSRGAA